MKPPTGATSATVADHFAALCRAELLGSADVVLRAAPGATSSLTTGQRDELLAKCAAGEYVEVFVKFLAYEQDDTANRNFIRFADKALPRMAKAGAGIPLLRDHDSYDLLARAGTVIEATHEVDAKGKHTIRMEAKVTAPWAVEALLRENIDRFSIHARPTGPVLCSACNTPVGESCWHFPGDRLAETTDENGKKSLQRSRSGSTVVQWIYTAAELVETSAVSVPAVPAARIETVRAAMLAARGITAAELEPAHEDPPMTTIALALMSAALGLPSTSTAEQVEAHARSQTARLHTLEAAHAEQSRRLAAQEVELSAVREAAQTREIEEFMTSAVNEGKVAPGGPTETSLRAYFKADPAGARALLKTLPRVTPAGQPRQSGPTATGTAGAGAGSSGGDVDAPAAELAALDQELANQGARPAGVRAVLEQFGRGGAAAKLAKYGPTVLGIAPR